MFRERRETLFMPVMDSVGGYLAAKGFQHEIVVTEADSATPPRERTSRFCFRVIEPSPRRDIGDCSRLSVVCDPFADAVRFSASHAGAAAPPTGAMTVEAVDLRVFQEQILTFIASLFR